MEKDVLVKDKNCLSEIYVDRLLAQKLLSKEILEINLDKKQEKNFYLIVSKDVNLKNFSEKDLIEYLNYVNKLKIGENLTHEFLKSKQFYGNMTFLSPENEIMFKGSNKKAFWYLYKNLVDIIDDDKETPVLKFKFNPAGLGHEKKYYKEDLKNNCVCCNDDKYLTRHHVVPYAFRKHMPLEYKEHNSHDVLLLCTSCHNKYELIADQKLDNLFSDLQKTKETIDYNNQLKKLSYLNKLKKIVFKIENENNLPKIAKEKMIEKLYLNVDLYNELFFTNCNKENFIEEIKNKDLLIINKSLYEQYIEKIKYHNGLDNFVLEWRRHFIDTMKPRYLNKNWSIHNPTNKQQKNKL